MIDGLKWPLSLAVLCLVLMALEPARVWGEVQALQPGWLGLALAVTVLQTLLSAWRWRFTASRLGLDLPWRQAVGDYYLASFVNQTLPGGVLGDAWRAHRHAAGQRDGGAAWRAVLIERGSGQLLVVGLGLVSLLVLVQWQGANPSPPNALETAWRLGWGLALLAGVLALLLRLSQRFWQPHWRRFRDDLGRALLARSALLPQLASSGLIVSSYALVFLLAARAIGVTLEAAILLSLALPVLLAMLVPLSIAGWGWREALAGGLWMSLGLPPEQGVAVSLAYGVIVFLAATPGIAVWLSRPARSARPDRARTTLKPPRSGRDQQPARRPGESCASSVDRPRSGVRWGED